MHLLAVLKPDGVIRKASGAGILRGLLDQGLGRFASFKKVIVPPSLLAEHYRHVQNRGFFPWLMRYMSSYPCYVMLVEVEGKNIERIRGLLGATRAHRADVDTLRYRFCPYGGANGLHLSEDETSGEIETNLWRNALGVDNGQFDISIEDYIAANLGKPNHTAELRRILLDVARGGSSLSKEENRIKQLLREESDGAPENEVGFLYWVLTDQLAPDQAAVNPIQSRVEPHGIDSVSK